MDSKMDALAWLMGAAIVVVLLRWLGKKSVEPVIYEPLTQDVVRALLGALLYRGIELTKLTFREKATRGRQIVYGKLIHGWNDVDVTATVSASFVSRECVELLVDELDRRGIRYARTRSGEDNGDLLTLSFGQDIGLAQFFLNIAFERVFECSLSRDCIAFYNPHLLPLEGMRRAGLERRLT